MFVPADFPHVGVGKQEADRHVLRERPCEAGDAL
jgi:hypothetical protein